MLVLLLYFHTRRNCFTSLQNKLKSSQKDKVRQFMIFTQSNEKTALNCLQQNDWKLDVATDNFFQNPEIYVQNLKGTLDRKRLEQLYTRYRGKNTRIQNTHTTIRVFIKVSTGVSPTDRIRRNSIIHQSVLWMCYTPQMGTE